MLLPSVAFILCDVGGSQKSILHYENSLTSIYHWNGLSQCKPRFWVQRAACIETTGHSGRRARNGWSEICLKGVLSPCFEHSLSYVKMNDSDGSKTLDKDSITAHIQGLQKFYDNYGHTSNWTVFENGAASGNTMRGMLISPGSALSIVIKSLFVRYL